MLDDSSLNLVLDSGDSLSSHDNLSPSSDDESISFSRDLSLSKSDSESVHSRFEGVSGDGHPSSEQVSVVGPLVSGDFSLCELHVQDGNLRLVSGMADFVSDDDTNLLEGVLDNSLLELLELSDLLFERPPLVSDLDGDDLHSSSTSASACRSVTKVLQDSDGSSSEGPSHNSDDSLSAHLDHSPSTKSLDDGPLHGSDLSLLEGSHDSNDTGS